ncbi:MAG: flagellar hook-basal body complex protein [Lachnospiraceae bacterium]|jgi:flagellar hook protein FlgE|nr:flagellar hook-basal body complex protein [Lachnospiraceae bacterium]
MMRSLFSGVSGLKTHQTRMDVIGNNIANVNTTAYKSSSMTFSALMSQTTKRASGPNALTGVGGTNARQIGLGVKAGAINTNITGQGSAQSTGNPFDIMITGEAFFVVNNGVSNYFTRDGSFYVDGAGNLAMTSTGYNVMGWQVDPDTQNIKKDTVTALRIMDQANMTYPPEATSQATIGGVIDSNDKDVSSPNGKSINLSFYDALGYQYTAKFVVKQSDNPHKFSLELDRIIDSTGKDIRDLEGNTLDVKELVKFSDALRGIDKTTKLGMDTTAYKWNGQVLETTDTPAVPLADLAQMFEANGELKALDTELTINDKDGNPITVGQALDNIAMVHGYEGSTDEFLKLGMKVETPNATTGGNDVTYVSMKTLLFNSTSNTDPQFPKLDATNSSVEMTAYVFDGVVVSYNPDTGVFDGLNGAGATNSTFNLNLSALGGNFSNITVDMSQSSNYDKKGTSTLAATSGDKGGVGAGRRLGEMIGLTIQDNGMIYATYDSGMTKLLGQIATAMFANASGLEKSGDNLYSATLNSGEFDGIGVDITADGGYMTSGQLEMSNVDLSSEFTEMITTQRGFQANSRIITVSDTLLEELTNLKR